MELSELSLGLDQLSLGDLRKLERDVPKQIQRVEREQRRIAFEAVEKRAAEMGLSKTDLRGRYGRNGENSNRTEAGARYRHPETGETWAGRGRKPVWLKQYEGQGGDIQDLAIEREG